jgi:hypothetical protein
MDDKQWREQVNDRLASLTAGETVQNDKIDEINEEMDGMKEILDGKSSDRADMGIKGDIDEIKTRLRRIDGILWPDAAGNAGLVRLVNQQAKRDEREERRSDRWWKGLTPVIVAIVSTIGLVLTNLDRIVDSWHKLRPSAAAVEKTKTRGSKRNGTKRRPVAPPVESLGDGLEDQ